MKRLSFLLLVLFVCVTNITAQNLKVNDGGNDLSVMKWHCPAVEYYKNLLDSLADEDVRVYATKVMDKFKVYTSPTMPSEKIILTQAVIKVDNPNFEVANLLDIIAYYFKKSGWKEKLDIDVEQRRIDCIHEAEVARHYTLLEESRVNIKHSLSVILSPNNELIIHLATPIFITKTYSSSTRQYTGSQTYQVADVYPFKQKSSYKNTFSKAYIGTYAYFWNVISGLREHLNVYFLKDIELIRKNKYKHSNDSLFAKYGDPTKVIKDDVNQMDVNSEIRFYEKAQKVVFKGKTIDFKDIMSCEIVDDPTIIPGRSTTVGGGLGLFGFGLAAKETVTTASKTIHNYVVNIRIDKLDLPFIQLVTGENEMKAIEIASTFEYILRHQVKETKATKPTYTKRRK